MDLLQALILGAVQGLSEFLPISSSGHLILIPYLFHWVADSVSFDIALHVGTALAVLLYFWRDWWEMVSAAITKPRSQAAKLFYLLIVGSIPGGLIGLVLDSVVESNMRAPGLVAVNLIIFASLLWYADTKKNTHREIKDLTYTDSILIGLAQSVALIPGVSRSGITITAALMRGLKRADAAKFSFLLSTPLIIGAAALKSLDFVKGDIASSEYGAFAAGLIASFIVGLAVIRFLLRFIQKNSFKVFIVYRIAVGVVILLLLLLGY